MLISPFCVCGFGDQLVQYAKLDVLSLGGKSIDPARTADAPGFEKVLAALPGLGVDLSAVNARLLADGLEAFAQSFRDMMKIIADKRAELTNKA